MSSEARVLVVDDHPEMVRLLADQLADEGFAVDMATGGEEALNAARSRLYDVVLCDLRMEKVDGFDVLAGLKSIDPALPVLLMTAFGGIDSAVEAIKRGAYHYLTKPFRLDEVLLYVRRAVDERRLREEHRALKEAVRPRSSIIGASEPMKGLLELVERVADSDAPALIRGESGTGKELVARALHDLGPRKDRTFVPVNCTAIPENLLESELFGHVRGAFSGATTARHGLFVEADGGTLFLDEIGDMPAELQAKLLRVLENGEIRPVGADASRKVDVRIVAATHQDLEQRVKDGKFRADLFYRLNVVPVSIPPLRERREDIPALIEHFLAAARERNPRARVRRFSPEVVQALARANWPGNIRELENVVERLVIVTNAEVVGPEMLGRHVPGLDAPEDPLGRARQQVIPLRQLENDYIAWAVTRCGGNKTRAAELLGIDVSTIHRRERERAG
ncbi:MAG: sigma-54-dependent transcriptional regulator [Myxococcales bacterium]